MHLDYRLILAWRFRGQVLKLVKSHILRVGENGGGQLVDMGPNKIHT